MDWKVATFTRPSRRRLVAAAAGLLLVASPSPATAQIEEGKLTASDAAGSDFFGSSVSVSGDTAVVGSPSDDPDGSGSRSGSAYVFTREGSSWTEQAKLTASDAASGDDFGDSVSVSGDTAVVGSPSDDDAGSASGSAYVFTRTGSTWMEQAKLTASDAAAGDWFGYSVSVSGDTVVVGARRDDHTGAADAGSAYVFTRTGSTWTEQAKLTASDTAGGDNFGVSVSVSGDTAVLGSSGDDDAGSGSGSAYVFSRADATWTEQAKLRASDAAGGDFFGFSVSVSGDTAVVGSSGDDDAGAGSGSAYVFLRTDATWTEQAKLTASDAAAAAEFGRSVSVTGDTAVVGAPLDEDAGSSRGSAYSFTRTGSAWTEQAQLTASDAGTGDNLGISVSVSGDRAVVGSPRSGTFDSGSAYAFDIGPPDTAIISGPPSPTSSASATIAFTATEPATFACSLDSGAPSPCASPVTATDLADGAHTFSVTATDAAGNTDPTPATHSWTVDTTPPDPTIATQEGAVLLNLPAMVIPVEGTASDDTSTVAEVSVRFTALTPGAVDVARTATLDCDTTGRECTWAAEPPDVPGRYEVRAQALDEAGNLGATGPITVTVLGLPVSP